MAMTDRLGVDRASTRLSTEDLARAARYIERTQPDAPELLEALGLTEPDVAPALPPAVDGKPKCAECGRAIRVVVDDRCSVCRAGRGRR